MIDAQVTASLVLRAQGGDTRAFTILVRTFLPAAFSVALAIVGRPADAEDIAQDAFVVALDRIKTCREPERFAGWLMQIVRNRARNWLDSRRLRDVAANDDAATKGVEIPGGQSIRPEEIGLKERLLAALDGVSPMQREVVLLHDLQDWTHSEIADVLDISEGMSRQHLFNARRLLRARLDGDALAERKS